MLQHCGTKGKIKTRAMDLSCIFVVHLSSPAPVPKYIREESLFGWKRTSDETATALLRFYSPQNQVDYSFHV